MRSSTCGAVGIKIINLGYNITLLLSIGGMNAAKHLTRYSCYAFILILVCTNECGGEILSLSLPPMEVAFFRAFAMVVFLLPIFFSQPFKSPNHKKGGFIFLFSRAFAGGLSFVVLFYNIATISLGTATAFSQSVPLYIVLLSFLFLKENIALV